MPVIRGKDIEEERERNCGALLKWFPIRPENDILDIIRFRRRAVDHDKLPMQKHMHPDFDEYWYVIEGSGKVWLDDEVYNVEVGDLAITPGGVSHKAEGDVTFLCFMCKYNSKGKTLGTKMGMVATDEPYREDPSMRATVGEYMEVDILEKAHLK